MKGPGLSPTPRSGADSPGRRGLSQPGGSVEVQICREAARPGAGVQAPSPSGLDSLSWTETLSEDSVGMGCCGPAGLGLLVLVPRGAFGTGQNNLPQPTESRLQKQTYFRRQATSDGMKLWPLSFVVGN